MKTPQEVVACVAVSLLMLLAISLLVWAIVEVWERILA